VAVRLARGSRILIANLRPESTKVELSVDTGARLTNFDAWTLSDPLDGEEARSGWRPYHSSLTRGRTLSLDLARYGIVRLDRGPAG
jgi:hypothetical protein